MNGRLDGNAIAGPLSALFQFDPTVAAGMCAACGDVQPLAASIVYSSDMGHVMRCIQCDNVLMTHVQTTEGTFLSTRGLTWLRVASDAGQGMRQ